MLLPPSFAAVGTETDVCLFGVVCLVFVQGMSVLRSTASLIAFHRLRRIASHLSTPAVVSSIAVRTFSALTGSVTAAAATKKSSPATATATGGGGGGGGGVGPLRSEFVHFSPIPTRWSDNDVYGHVNNAHYYALFDTAINQYLIRVGGLDIHTGSVIGLCVSSRCEYHQSLAFPDIIDAGLAVTKLGTSSVTYAIGLFHAADIQPQTTRGAATGQFTHVFVDRKTRKPTPIPDTLRAALTKLVRSPSPAAAAPPN